MSRTNLSVASARLVAGCVVCFAALTCAAQPAPTSNSPLAPPVNGPRRADTGHAPVAITGATLHAAPGKTIESGTLVFRAGVIERIETGAINQSSSGAPPIKRDYTGMHVYAGFLEPYLEVDVPRPDLAAPGSHWNPRVTPQRSALDKGSAGVDAATARALRELGFVAAAISPKGGIFRGTAAVVSLAPESPDASEVGPRVYADRAYQAMSFELTAPPDSDSGPPDSSLWPRYPGSQMGAIALIRQTLSDADWQSAGRSAGKFTDPINALDALALPSEADARGARGMPAVLFDVQDELEALRAIAVCDEFKRPLAILGSGFEFRRIGALAQAKRSMVVPLNYPQKPRVETIGEADAVSLRDLMAWEQAPTNLRRLDAAGLTVALTTSKIPDKAGGRGAFKERLGAAIKHGLSADRALAMLTTNPATILGLEKTFGTLDAGKAASFVVADGPLFTDKPDSPGKDEPGYVRPGKIVEVWIDGVRHAVSPRTRRDLAGEWEITLTPAPEGSPKITMTVDDNNEITITKITTGEDGKEKKATAKPVNVKFDDESIGGRFSYSFEHEPFGQKGVYISQGVVEREADGTLVMHADAQRADGKRFNWKARKTGPLVKDPRKPALGGTWTLVLPGGPAAPDNAEEPRLVIADKKVTVKRGDKEFKTETTKYEDNPALVVFTVKDLYPDKPELTVWLRPVKDQPDRLSASHGENDPEIFQLARSREKPETADIAAIPEKLGLPFGPYAYESLPARGTVVITGGTVWTCADKNAEVIENGVVVLKDGKIAAVGRAGSVNVPTGDGVETIDAKGKHITPGIIDCHSHTGISRGVNEGGQAVSAEVRIGDVTDPDSLSWYRQLAGGVTAMNSLHGSANAIGGQNQVNKNRWGAAHPADMHFEGAIPGIKFALGENVKQSNWGDRFTTRYPQTRMGVETLIRDRFTAAREYLAAMKAGGARRDLELEALAEIVEGKRLIHCHSYRQDEILMLCRVARDFGFRIGSFQHGLECYKVADEVRENARGASLFSDWWAYKMEVVDAIPYAGPILFSRAVPVSYNSDSDELARRLNVEAGKALKYALMDGVKMTPSDALKFVTLNPAKQLAVEDRVGSLETGKDADVVIWSGQPMSSMSRAEKTFVDGRLMFTLERDAELRQANQAERQRITQKLLAAEKRGGGGDGEKTGRGRGERGRGRGEPPPTEFDDEDRAGRATGRRSILADALRGADEYRAAYFLDLLKRGIDPQYHRGAECGCEVWLAQ